MELKDIERYIKPAELLYAECTPDGDLKQKGQNAVYRIIGTDSGGICVMPEGTGEPEEDVKPVHLIFKNVSEEKAVSTSLARSDRIGFVKFTGGARGEFHFLRGEKLGIKGVTVSDDFLAASGSGVDNLSGEFVFSAGGGNIVVLARKRAADVVGSGENDSFVFGGIDAKSERFVALDCLLSHDDDDNRYISVERKRPLKNDVEYEYSLVSVEPGAFFTRKREILRKSVQEAVSGRKNTFLELWREYCFSDYERTINAIVRAGILKIDKFDGDGFIIEDSGANIFSNFISEIDKVKVDDCYLLPRDGDAGNAVEKMNEFRGMSLKAQSREDKEKFVSDVRAYLKKIRKKTPLNINVKASSEKGKIVIQEDQEIGDKSIVGAAYILVSGRQKTSGLDKVEREFARIMDAEAPMPQLSEILLGINAEHEIRYKGKPNKRIPTEEISKYFAYTPTLNQVNALCTAYETPDIAVILGPPGTGKSGLIRAIIKAIEGRDKPLNGTLLTAYQHDALDSLIERATVNGLPCIRYGGRDKRNSDKILSLSFANQIREKAEELVRKYPKYAEKGILYKLKDQMAALDYMQLSFNSVCSYIDGINDLTKRYTPKSLRKLLDLRVKYAAKLSVGENIIPISAVNNLRCGKDAFDDDGKECFMAAKHCLCSPFEWLKKKNIKAAFDGYEAAVKAGDFESALECKLRLIAEMTADRKPIITEEGKQELRGILRDMIVEVEEKLALSGDLEAEIISDYIHTYVNNYGETLYAIKKYNKYVGSTHYQLDTNWNDMGFNESDDDENTVEFENVIIDEAARSSPNDLTVVMSCASKRVIFVGDHNQLPQFQDRELFEEAMGKVKEKNAELSQKGYDLGKDADCSLFEKLIKVVEKMRGQDKINRFAMLSEQFRSPPILGDFVSREFYKKMLVNGKKDPKEFEHGIPKYKKICAVFKEIPLRRGPETKDAETKSRYRICEAEWIADDVKEILDTCDRKLSIGIISFYKKQCGCVEDKLVDNDTAVRNEDGVVSVAPKYANSGHILFIGTVDAFQGKEFDVVYLSVTVANDRRNIGFLDSENRRCVALSREKKLLIVVGAPEMLENKDMGQIKRFRELCETSPEGKLLK